MCWCILASCCVYTVDATPNVLVYFSVMLCVHGGHYTKYFRQIQNMWLLCYITSAPCATCFDSSCHRPANVVTKSYCVRTASLWVCWYSEVMLNGCNRYVCAEQAECRQRCAATSSSYRKGGIVNERYINQLIGAVAEMRPWRVPAMHSRHVCSCLSL